jgi:hypothetical protein
VIALGLGIALSIPSRQSISLQDGRKLTFLGKTTGTNHWHPRFNLLERFMFELPGSLVPSHHPIGVQTPSIMMVLWFEVEIGPPIELLVQFIDDKEEAYASPETIQLPSGKRTVPLVLPDRPIKLNRMRIFEPSLTNASKYHELGSVHIK